MMMNAVGEPYPLQVHFHSLEVCRTLVAGIARIDGFQHPADSEVIFPVPGRTGCHVPAKRLP